MGEETYELLFWLDGAHLDIKSNEVPFPWYDENGPARCGVDSNFEANILSSI